MWNLKNNNEQLQQERKPSLLLWRTDMVVARGGGWGVGHTGEGGPTVLTSSYKTSHGDVTYSIMTIVSNAVLHI